MVATAPQGLSAAASAWPWPEREPAPQAATQAATRAATRGPPLPLLERQKIAERLVKAVYIHSHMDEENFDVSRIMKCSVGVPAPDGSNIPTCSYNVLYREADPRFADPKMLRRMDQAKGTPA